MDYIELILAFLCGGGVTYGLMRLKKPKYDGQIVVTVDANGKQTYILELNSDPADLGGQEVIVFKMTDRLSPGYDAA